MLGSDKVVNDLTSFELISALFSYLLTLDNIELFGVWLNIRVKIVLSPQTQLEPLTREQ